MKLETKQAKLAAMFGLEAMLPAKAKAPDPQEYENVVQASREAEATILYLEDPKKFKTRECGTCGFTFAVDRANISQCSDTCRKKHLLDNFGIAVNLNARSASERWAYNSGGREPLIVPPVVVAILKSLVAQESVTA